MYNVAYIPIMSYHNRSLLLAIWHEESGGSRILGGESWHLL
ncbi:hypothetical protein HMPREF1985_02307 [Mitsuokella sp. oral taxon 131 str. W9106]|nr:hypothetical protein HMPREF1985_02307 [Mitsuokella sp. oral taxon 131 str. W9106]